MRHQLKKHYKHFCSKGGVKKIQGGRKNVFHLIGAVMKCWRDVLHKWNTQAVLHESADNLNHPPSLTVANILNASPYI